MQASKAAQNGAILTLSTPQQIPLKSHNDGSKRKSKNDIPP